VAAKLQKIKKSYPLPSFLGGMNMDKTLIIGTGDLYTVVVSTVGRNQSIDVMSYDQYLLALTNKVGGRTRVDNLVEMTKQLIIYDVVYIISDSLNEGFELTSFFSEMGIRTVINVTPCSRHYQLYKKLGAKHVIISKPGDYLYSWLQRDFYR
jgi:hypothetical protein